MGIGDDIIASGHAKREFERTGRRVMLIDARGRARWSDMWKGLPWIAHPVTDRADPNLERLPNGARCRPYIDYRKGFTRQTGMNYTGWRVRDNVGFIQLTGDEMDFAAAHAKELGNFVVIEHQIETGSNPNKQWGLGRWQALALSLKAHGFNPIHMGPKVNALPLQGVCHVMTPTIRHAAALMKFARWSILPDAGLAHVAGVLGLPATVLWGGANDPEILGYAGHDHIYFPTHCGVWLPCSHCQTIWRGLSPSYVFARADQAMRNRYGENYRSR